MLIQMDETVAEFANNAYLMDILYINLVILVSRLISVASESKALTRDLQIQSSLLLRRRDSNPPPIYQRIYRRRTPPIYSVL